MKPPMSPSPKRREGFALAVAMIAIVVIGALIAGAFFTSTQEYRAGRNSLVDQRAYTAAEAGVTQPIQGWLKSLNLAMTNGATNDPDTLRINGGGYAVRRVTRLDDYTFWVMSDGYAGGTTGSLASHHRVNAVYRLAYPSFNIIGALTVRGKVEVQGSSRVDGHDEIRFDRQRAVPRKQGGDMAVRADTGELAAAVDSDEELEDSEEMADG